MVYHKANIRNYDPWVAKVETESDESVSHDQTEPNDPIDVEIEFDGSDIADFVAENAPLAAQSEVSNAVYDMLYYLPDNIADLIAAHYADDDDFKQWLCEHKDVDLGWHKGLKERDE